jgi:hypothetical protein
MSSNDKIKYDDFGEVIWREPKRKRIKKFTFSEVFKRLGEALI